MRIPDLLDADAGLVLAPFRGLRYNATKVGDLTTVTAPPYDLIDDNELSRLFAMSPYNIARLTYPCDRGMLYEGAGAALRRWCELEILMADDVPAFYVYEMRYPGAPKCLMRGLIGALGVGPDLDDVIIPHEDVLPEAIERQRRLISSTCANLEPILLYYTGGEAIDRIIAATAAMPILADATDPDGRRHLLWRITDPVTQARIAADLRRRRALIADGHHRYATYRLLQDKFSPDDAWSHALALLVDGVRYPPQVSAIHRFVPDLPGHTAARLARRAFTVRQFGTDLNEAASYLSALPGPAFILAGQGWQFLLTNPDPAQLASAIPLRSDGWRALPTAVLHELLIPCIWGITETERSVQIVRGDAATAADKSRDTGTAVILQALHVSDVFAVASGGERVPRKSTSFSPKPRTGLVLRLANLG